MLNASLSIFPSSGTAASPIFYSYKVGKGALGRTGFDIPETKWAAEQEKQTAFVLGDCGPEGNVTSRGHLLPFLSTAICQAAWPGVYYTHHLLQYSV